MSDCTVEKLPDNCLAEKKKGSKILLILPFVAVALFALTEIVFCLLYSVYSLSYDGLLYSMYSFVSNLTGRSNEILVALILPLLVCLAYCWKNRKASICFAVITLVALLTQLLCALVTPAFFFVDMYDSVFFTLINELVYANPACYLLGGLLYAFVDFSFAFEDLIYAVAQLVASLGGLFYIVETIVCLVAFIRLSFKK